MEVSVSTQYLAAGVIFVLFLISTGILAKLIGLCAKAEQKSETYSGKMAMVIIIGVAFVLPLVITWIRFVFVISNDLL